MKKTLYTMAVLGASCMAAFAQVPNGGFENWDSATMVNGHTIYDPVDWLSSNAEMVSIGKAQPISISTDSHTGSYALKITSTIDDGAQQGALIASERFPLTGGRIKYFEAYYKYTPVSSVPSDSFRVYLQMYKDGQEYGQAYFLYGAPTPDYTYFKWELTYPDNVPAPDSAGFLIQASIYNDSEGSILLLDDIAVGYQIPTGIDEKNELANISIYPNPANDRITFLGYPPRRPYGYHIRNITGQLVASGQLTSESLDISFLGRGLYFVTLNDDQGNNSTYKMIKQ